MTQSFLTPNCIVSEIEKEKEKKEGIVYYLNSEFIKSVLIFLTSNQQPIFRLID